MRLFFVTACYFFFFQSEFPGARHCKSPWYCFHSHQTGLPGSLRLCSILILPCSLEAAKPSSIAPGVPTNNPLELWALGCAILQSAIKGSLTAWLTELTPGRQLQQRVYWATVSGYSADMLTPFVWSDPQDVAISYFTFMQKKSQKIILMIPSGVGPALSQCKSEHWYVCYINQQMQIVALCNIPMK